MTTVPLLLLLMANAGSACWLPLLGNVNKGQAWPAFPGSGRIHIQMKLVCTRNLFCKFPLISNPFGFKEGQSMLYLLFLGYLNVQWVVSLKAKLNCAQQSNKRRPLLKDRKKKSSRYRIFTMVHVWNTNHTYRHTYFKWSQKYLACVTGHSWIRMMT